MDDIRSGNFPRAPTTLLAGRWLRLARLGWILLALVIMGVFLWAVPVRVNELMLDPYHFQPTLTSMGLTLEVITVYDMVFTCLLGAACLGISLVIFWRKSDDWLALLVSMAQLSTLALLPEVNSLIGIHPALKIPLFLLKLTGVIFIFLVYCLFPDGRFVPRWSGFLIILLILVGSLMAIFPDFIPPAVPIDLKGWKDGLGSLFLLAMLASAAAAQIYRYMRVTGAVQRQQTRLVVIGLALFCLSPFAILLPVILFPILHTTDSLKLVMAIIDIPVSTLLWFLLPLSLAISILKYHLWDIEVIIRRTLIYGALTVTLAAVYSVGVIFFQWLFQTFTGQHQSPLAVVISTLVIAALFNPLRRRIQADIDRRLFRSKYSADQLLAAFGGAIRNETGLEQLTGRLLAVVDETIQPETLNLWLKEPMQGNRNMPH